MKQENSTKNTKDTQKNGINTKSFLQKEVNLLDTLQKSQNEIINNKSFGYSMYTEEYKSKIKDEKTKAQESYYNVKDFSTRGLSWNIAFLDNILRDESYVENAVTWSITKALQNGIDLNIRDENVDPDKVIKITDTIKNDYMKPLYDFGVLGRGYGGSGGLIVIDGITDKEEMLKPLVASNVRKGANISIRPLTRLYQIIPDYSREDRMINKVGKDVGIYDDTELGKPQYYRVSISGGMYRKEKGDLPSGFDNFVNTFLVHRSRLLIYNGNKLSWIEEYVEQFFGIALSVRALDEIKRYKLALDEIMKLLNRSNIPVINISGFENISRSGDVGLKKIDELITAYQYALDVGDIIAIGAKDEEELKYLQAEFRELSNILLDRKKELSAALQAPLSVTFKEKDELDESEHYYAIQEIQERQFRPALKQIIPLIYSSLFGEDIPDYSFVFRSLETPTEKDKIDKLKIATEIINTLFTSNLITSGEGKQMLIAASNNVNDMFYEISKYYNDENKDKLFKDFQIEIANNLNWNNKKDDLEKGNKEYNMAETKVKGNNEGGDPKKTKKIGIDL